MYTFMAHSVRTPLKHVSSSRYSPPAGMYLTQLVFSTSLLCPGSCDYTSTVTIFSTILCIQQREGESKVMTIYVHTIQLPCTHTYHDDTGLDMRSRTAERTPGFSHLHICEIFPEIWETILFWSSSAYGLRITVLFWYSSM